MNGQGATGYCYYENVPQGEYAWVEKQGQFVDDEMEGSISYEIRGTDDTLSHWDMNVSQGKIQLDERWLGLNEIWTTEGKIDIISKRKIRLNRIRYMNG